LSDSFLHGFSYLFCQNKIPEKFKSDLKTIDELMEEKINNFKITKNQKDKDDTDNNDEVDGDNEVEPVNETEEDVNN